ncbi:MAG: LytTR family DNA-binding domain-containing protein [Oleiphilaceae bacterium]|nr:LytTR family DNA-binding domain-containing protein [Oleiphilaceae bacterium]
MNERRVLIVDDEVLARDRLRRLLQALPGYRVCGEADSGESALEQATRTQPDIVLLDIRMPGLDGMDAAARFNALPMPPALIFCSAYDSYAMQAIRQQAAAYLVKPVRREALEEALLAAQRTNRLQQQEVLTQRQAPQTQIVVRSHRGLELIDLADLYYCMADSKYVTLVHRQGSTLCDHTLKELEAEHGVRLMRIHRQTLVNRRHVRGLIRGPDGQHQIRMADPAGSCLAVSRRHLAPVRQWLEQGD